MSLMCKLCNMLSFGTILCHIFTSSNALNTYASDGINYWDSTSDFVPIQNTSYGTIKLRTGFHMTFDILFHSKTVSAWENIFRIGHAGHSESDYKCDKNDRFPAMWISGANDAFVFDISDRQNCFRQYSNYLITPHTLYTVAIDYNSSFAHISINDSIITSQPRIDTTEAHKLNTDVHIYLSTVTSIPANVRLSNIRILSYHDSTHILSDTPTDTPTLYPTVTPTRVPTVYTISKSPSKKPTTFLPTIEIRPTQANIFDIYTTNSEAYTSPQTTDTHIIIGTDTNANSTAQTEIFAEQKKQGLSFEVIFYILTGCAMGGILFCVCTCCCFGFIINKRIKILSDEGNDIIADESFTQRKQYLQRHKLNPSNNSIKMNRNHYYNASLKTVRLSTMSDDSNDDSLEDCEINVVNVQTPTTSPTENMSSPSSHMTESLHSNSSKTPQTRINRRSNNHSNNHSNQTRITHKLSTDTTRTTHESESKISIQRNSNNGSDAQHSKVSHTTDSLADMRPKLQKINHTPMDSGTDTSIMSSPFGLHRRALPMPNCDGYERRHFFECRKVSTVLPNNSGKVLEIIGGNNRDSYDFSKSHCNTLQSVPSTHYSLCVHKPNSNTRVTHSAKKSRKISKKYQIQIDYANANTNEIQPINTADDTQDLYGEQRSDTSLGDIEIDSDDLKSEIVTIQRESNKSLKSLKSFSGTVTTVIVKDGNGDGTESESENTKTVTAIVGKDFLRLPAINDSIISDQSNNSNSSVTTNGSNSSHVSSSNMSSSNMSSSSGMSDSTCSHSTSMSSSGSSVSSTQRYAATVTTVTTMPMPMPMRLVDSVNKGNINDLHGMKSSCSGSSYYSNAPNTQY